MVCGGTLSIPNGPGRPSQGPASRVEGERFMLGWSGRVQDSLVSDAQICLDVLLLKV